MYRLKDDTTVDIEETAYMGVCWIYVAEDMHEWHLL